MALNFHLNITAAYLNECRKKLIYQEADPNVFQAIKENFDMTSSNSKPDCLASISRTESKAHGDKVQLSAYLGNSTVCVCKFKERTVQYELSFSWGWGKKQAEKGNWRHKFYTELHPSKTIEALNNPDRS